VDMESCSQTPGTVLLYNTLFSLYWNWICKLYVGFYSCFFVSSHNQSQRQCQLFPLLGISQQFTFHIVIFSSERLMQVLTFFSRAKYNFIQVYAHFVFATIKKNRRNDCNWSFSNIYFSRVWMQLRCYWKQLWSRWAMTDSWEPLVLC
jgi:hypothetical protein